MHGVSTTWRSLEATKELGSGEFSERISIDWTVDEWQFIGRLQANQSAKRHSIESSIEVSI